MLNEPSSMTSGKPDQSLPAVLPTIAQRPNTAAQNQIETAVSQVLQITNTEYHPNPPLMATFTGRLRLDSEAAFAQLDGQLAPLDYHTLLSINEQDQHVITIIKGRVNPKPRPWWPNALLLVLTLLSLLYVGSLQDESANSLSDIWRGWPYALSLILILGTHELGHYFAARHHKVNVTLPYFIPAPISGFGTLGAFIQLRAPMPNRKVLFDVGVAGPLAGLIVAIPILIIGLATSHIEALPKDTYILEGDLLIYLSAKLAIFGKLLPNGHEDVFINQVAKAGWTGLFITGLNLIPVGQLDGGHVLSTLFGRRAARLYIPVLITFVVLSFFNAAWLLWTLLLLLFGRFYAVPLDSITPLDRRRRMIGYVAILVFVLVFVPNPLQIVNP